MAFDYPSVATKKKKEKEKKAKSKKNIETKSGDMLQANPDILGKRFDEKFRKHALSKESHLHAKDYDDGINKGEARAMKEVLQEAGIPIPKFAKGGRTGFKVGGAAKRGISKILRKK